MCRAKKEVCHLYHGFSRKASHGLGATLLPEEYLTEQTRTNMSAISWNSLQLYGQSANVCKCLDSRKLSGTWFGKAKRQTWICHGYTDIICVQSFVFWGKFFAKNIQCFAQTRGFFFYICMVFWWHIYLSRGLPWMYLWQEYKLYKRIMLINLWVILPWMI